MSSDGEKVVAVVQAVRYKKQDGVLVLTREGLGWSPDGVSELMLNVPYSRQKSHRLSKEGGSKVQLQLVEHDGTTINLHFTGESAKAERAHVSKLLLQMVPHVTQQASAELEAKKALLQSDPSLHQLYRDLVISEIISADEFWANHLPTDDRRTEQQSGIPSAFLVDVPAVADGCNAIRLNITPDEIQAIFTTYPSVKSKHAQLVPDQMTEADFWVQFFQSQKFHRDRQRSSANGSMFDECLQRDLTAVASSTQSAGRREILPSMENPAEGYSEDTLEPTTNQVLVQRCNMHSALVLHAIHSEGTSSGRTLSSAGLEEVALQMQTASPRTRAETTPTALQHLAQELSTNNARLQPLNSSSATQAMSHLLPGGSLMAPGRSTTNITLSSTARRLLVRHQTAIAELLRHFWACFPVVSPTLEEKVHRMARCLQQYKEEKLAQLHSELSPSELPVMEHLSSCLAAALSRYQEWLSRQTANNS